VSEPVTYKYRAFLSYSHRDTEWGKWLHKAIEGYRIDKDLVGRTTSCPKHCGQSFGIGRIFPQDIR
jgi:hypothetical protein